MVAFAALVRGLHPPALAADAKRPSAYDQIILSMSIIQRLENGMSD